MKPTMADRFIAAKLSFSNIGKMMQAVQRKTRLAEKFVFDARSQRPRRNGVARRARTVGRTNSVRPPAPFDLCWIEYDVDVIFATLNPMRASNRTSPATCASGY